MNERLPLHERPITKSRQAFIEALKTTPRPEELDRTELDDLLEMYGDLMDDITELGDAARAEVERRIVSETTE